MSPAATPAHNPAAEQAVLACCLVDAGALPTLARAKLLTPAAFFEVRHQQIFTAMLALQGDGVPVDEIVLGDVLRARGQEESTGGPAYLATLAQRVETATQLLHWARIVRKNHLLRQVATLGQKLVEQAHGAYETVEDFLTPATATANDIVNLGRLEESGGEPLRAAVEVLERRAADWEAGKAQLIDPAAEITWGLDSLDARFTKINKTLGDLLILVMGMSSHGKSAFARFLMGANLLLGRTVAGFLLETTPTQFIDRFAGMKARFDVAEFRRGKTLSELEAEYRQFYPGEKFTREWSLLRHNFSCYQAWLEYLKGVADQRLRLYGRLHHMAQIAAEARLIAREGPLDLILIDYLQLVKREHRGTQRGDEVLKEIISDTKALAAELDCPVLLVSSVTDDGESDQTPDFNRARGSKDIAYGSDRAITVFRPKRDSNGESQEVNRTEKAHAPLDLRIKQTKARDLPVWEQKVLFTGKYTLFQDIPDEAHRGRPAGVKNGEGASRRGTLPPGWQWGTAEQTAAL